MTTRGVDKPYEQCSERSEHSGCSQGFRNVPRGLGQKCSQGFRNVPNIPDVPNVPNVPNDVPNIPGHVGPDELLAEGYVAKISILRLNFGSDMLRLSSCMLRLSLTSPVQGGPLRHSVWRPPPPWTDEVRLSASMHELSLMPEPMLRLSMLILATYPVAALDVAIRT